MGILALRLLSAEPFAESPCECSKSDSFIRNPYLLSFGVIGLDKIGYGINQSFISIPEVLAIEPRIIQYRVKHGLYLARIYRCPGFHD